MKNCGYIYKTTNLINNKIYIGKSTRKNRSKTYFGSGLYLKRAIKLYGRDNFKQEILLDNIEENHLNEYEINYINEYRNILGRKNMYNISDGGGGGGLKNHKINCHCIFCGPIGKNNKGSNNPMFNKHHTKETKEKIRISKLGKKIKYKHKFDCQCCACKAKRGEYKGKNNPNYGNGDKIKGNKNPNWKGGDS